MASSDGSITEAKNLNVSTCFAQAVVIFELAGEQPLPPGITISDISFSGYKIPKTGQRHQTHVRSGSRNTASVG